MLIELGILTVKSDITILGRDIFELPIQNHPRMQVSMMEALSRNQCGLDLIILSSCMYLEKDTLALINNNKNIAGDGDEGDIKFLVDLFHDLIEEKNNNPRLNFEDFAKGQNVPDSKQ